jgi:FtsZ-interacting cell division protein YlmF
VGRSTGSPTLKEAARETRHKHVYKHFPFFFQQSKTNPPTSKPKQPSFDDQEVKLLQEVLDREQKELQDVLEQERQKYKEEQRRIQEEEDQQRDWLKKQKEREQKRQQRMRENLANKAKQAEVQQQQQDVTTKVLLRCLISYISAN